MLILVSSVIKVTLNNSTIKLSDLLYLLLQFNNLNLITK